LSDLLKRSASFSLLASLFSLTALIGPPEPHPAIRLDVAFTIEEFSSHFLFGMAAVLPSLSPGLAAYGAIAAVTIDLDHLPVALGFQLIGRPAHSLTFLALSAAVMGIALRSGKHFDWPLGLATAAAVLSHISYDLYEASRLDFPLLMPIHPINLALPSGLWAPLQVAAISCSAAAGLPRWRQLEKALRRILRNGRTWRRREKAT